MADLLSRRDETLALRLAAGQPESAGEFNDFLDRVRARVVEAALAEEPVRRRLEGVRHRVVAVDYREDKPADSDERPVRLADVFIYDYDGDVLVVAVMHLGEGELVELDERRGDPPISAEELDEARRILQDEPRIARALQADGVQVVGFPTPGYAFTGHRDNHRGCTVFAGTADGDPVMATVDLSARSIVPDEDLPADLLRFSRARAE
jgi:hypothetical protein